MNANRDNWKFVGWSEKTSDETCLNDTSTSCFNDTHPYTMLNRDVKFNACIGFLVK